MQEIAWTVIAYLQGNAVLSIGIAFIAGFAAHKSVTRDAKSGILLVLIVGLSGLFLGEFLLLYTGLMEFLEKLPELRLLFDFIAAYVGSFIVATIIHFVKPM